jgi:hypothetical protein
MNGADLNDVSQILGHKSIRLGSLTLVTLADARVEAVIEGCQ